MGELILIIILIATIGIWGPPLAALVLVLWLRSIFPEAVLDRLCLSLLILWIGVPIVGVIIAPFLDPYEMARRKFERLNPQVAKIVKQIYPTYEVTPMRDPMSVSQHLGIFRGVEKGYEFGWWISSPSGVMIPGITLHFAGGVGTSNIFFNHILDLPVSFSVHHGYTAGAEEASVALKKALRNAGFKVSQN